MSSQQLFSESYSKRNDITDSGENIATVYRNIQKMNTTYDQNISNTIIESSRNEIESYFLDQGFLSNQFHLYSSLSSTFNNVSNQEADNDRIKVVSLSLDELNLLNNSLLLGRMPLNSREFIFYSSYTDYGLEQFENIINKSITINGNILNPDQIESSIFDNQTISVIGIIDIQKIGMDLPLDIFSSGNVLLCSNKDLVDLINSFSFFSGQIKLNFEVVFDFYKLEGNFLSISNKLEAIESISGDAGFDITYNIEFSDELSTFFKDLNREFEELSFIISILSVPYYLLLFFIINILLFDVDSTMIKDLLLLYERGANFKDRMILLLFERVIISLLTIIFSIMGSSLLIIISNDILAIEQFQFAKVSILYTLNPILVILFGIVLIMVCTSIWKINRQVEKIDQNILETEEFDNEFQFEIIKGKNGLLLFLLSSTIYFILDQVRLFLHEQLENDIPFAVELIINLFQVLITIFLLLSIILILTKVFSIIIRNFSIRKFNNPSNTISLLSISIRSRINEILLFFITLTLISSLIMFNIGLPLSVHEHHKKEGLFMIGGDISIEFNNLDNEIEEYIKNSFPTNSYEILSTVTWKPLIFKQISLLIVNPSTFKGFFPYYKFNNIGLNWKESLNSLNTNNNILLQNRFSTDSFWNTNEKKVIEGDLINNSQIPLIELKNAGIFHAFPIIVTEEDIETNNYDYGIISEKTMQNIGNISVDSSLVNLKNFIVFNSKITDDEMNLFSERFRDSIINIKSTSEYIESKVDAVEILFLDIIELEIFVVLFCEIFILIMYNKNLKQKNFNQNYIWYKKGISINTLKLVTVIEVFFILLFSTLQGIIFGIFLIYYGSSILQLSNAIIPFSPEVAVQKVLTITGLSMLICLLLFIVLVQKQLTHKNFMDA